MLNIADKIKAMAKVTNRCPSQSAHLLELCDDDFSKLIVLEQKILDNYIEYCPLNKRDVVRIMNLPRALESKFSVGKEFEFEITNSNRQIKTLYSDKWEHYAG